MNQPSTYCGGKEDSSVNRRSFIRKILGAGAALYVPEKAYGFLFPDKCESWRQSGTIALTMTFDTENGLWVPGSAESKHRINSLIKAFHKGAPATVWART